MAAAVRVLLFASAREVVGHAVVLRPIPSEGVELRAFLEELERAFPRLRAVLRVSGIARNGELLARPSGRVSPGDEIAIHPPYSGG